MKVAVIDLGTNTFHLLIADTDRSKKWKKVLQSRITVKLGQQGIHKNIIAESSYKRGIRAIEKFHLLLKKNRVKPENTFAFGTAAIRSSGNGRQFLNEINKISGVSVNMISGLREAELIFQGVRQAVELDSGNSLIMDIGGGSVEFIIGNKSGIRWKHSFRLGAAFLLEFFKPSDPIRVRELAEMRKYIERELKPLSEACKKYKPNRIIGSAGSFETFSSMLRYRYKNAGSHYGKTSHPISAKHFKMLYRELVTSDKIKRNNMKGLIKMRVDMIVQAAVLLDVVIKITNINSLLLSAYALKEGALLEVIKKLSVK